MRKINVPKAWRYGGKLIHAGVYRVPADISEIYANRAVADGCAEEIREAVQPKAVYQPKMKTPAPENKILGVARDNKSAISTETPTSSNDSGAD